MQSSGKHLSTIILRKKESHFELEFGNVGFSKVRETGVPGEKPSELGDNQQPTHIWRTGER